jgi:hypothetical protein
MLMKSASSPASSLPQSTEIVSFVDKRLGWDGTATHDGFFKSSFDVCMHIKRGESDEHIVIRFP